MRLLSLAAILLLSWLPRSAVGQQAAAPAPAPVAEGLPPSPTPEVRRLWLQAEVGYSWMDMGQFAFAYGGYGSHLVPRRDDGVSLQGALGGRFRWFTLGARAGTSRYSAYAVNVVGGEVGFQWPVRWLEPRLQLHAGYAWHGEADLDLPSPGLSGPAFGGGTSLRAHLGRWCVLGLSFDMDLMWLTGRIRLGDEGDVDLALNEAFRQAIAQGTVSPEQSGQGYQLRVSLMLGVRLW